MKPKSSAYPKEIKGIGDLIRRKRLDLGLFQRQVALLIDVHEVTFRRWERGFDKPANRYHEAIQKILGVPGQPGEFGEEAQVMTMSTDESGE